MQTWNIAQNSFRNLAPNRNSLSTGPVPVFRNQGFTPSQSFLPPQQAIHQLFHALEALSQSFQGFGAFAGQPQAPQGTSAGYPSASPVQAPSQNYSNTTPPRARHIGTQPTLAPQPNGNANGNGAAGNTLEYKLQYGDTLWDLATRKAGISLDEFQKLNPNVDFDNYSAGQTIVLPNSASQKLEGWAPATPGASASPSPVATSPTPAPATDSPRQSNPPSTENTFQSPPRQSNPPSTENTFQTPTRSGVPHNVI